MAYFNNTHNANLYPTPSTFGEPDAYPVLNHTLATEEMNEQTYSTLTDRWSTVGQPGPMISSPTRTSHGKYHGNTFR